MLRGWRRHYGDDPAEADRLEAMILERARAELDATHFEHANAFTHYQFGRHLRNYQTFASPYGYGFAIVRIVSVAAGLVSSTIAGVAVHPALASRRDRPADDDHRSDQPDLEARTRWTRRSSLTTDLADQAREPRDLRHSESRRDALALPVPSRGGGAHRRRPRRSVAGRPLRRPHET
jgi:hypothetical protein